MPDSCITQQNHSSSNTLLDTSEKLHTALIVTYIISLVGGGLRVIMTCHQLFRRRSQSVMTIIIINLLVLHTFMLLSIPFHLSYYILHGWKVGRFACRLASATIYPHMYTTVAFYVAIVTLHLLRFEFRKCYTLTWVGTTWLLGAPVVTPILLSYYDTSKTYSSCECFQFQGEIQEPHMVIANDCLVGILVAVFAALTVIQMTVICRLAVKCWPNIKSHMEFRAQAKSFFFILVTLVCFMTHNVPG